MGWLIGQIAEKTGLTTHTLRYYEKAGLMPFVKKSGSGLRVYTESDLEWLNLIDCLKSTGMSLKDIKQYMDWVQEGDKTLENRAQMFQKRRKAVEEEIKKLQGCLEKLDFKIAYYAAAKKYGESHVFERDLKLKAQKAKLFPKVKS